MGTSVPFVILFMNNHIMRCTRISTQNKASCLYSLRTLKTLSHIILRHLTVMIIYELQCNRCSAPVRFALVWDGVLI